MTTGESSPLLAHLFETLGPIRVVRHQVKRSDKQLALVTDSQERLWYGKLSSPAAWRREVRAYRRWVPALGNRAPRLADADRERRTLIVQSLRGRAATKHDAWAFADAGALLRRYHEGTLAPRHASSDAVADWIRRSRIGAEKAEEEAARLGLSVPPGLVRAALDGFDRWAPPRLVPTHGDFQPHNWVLDEDGAVQVVDFGDSAPRPAVYDLGQLLFRTGWDRPDLMTRFLNGYGWSLAEEERQLLRAWLGLHAVRARNRAVHRGYGPQHRRSEAVLEWLHTGRPLPLP